MEQREEENLALVKIAGWRKIPMDLDILIMDEIGKNISGAGMDTKVVNRGVHGRVQSLARTRRSSSASSCAT